MLIGRDIREENLFLKIQEKEEFVTRKISNRGRCGIQSGGWWAQVKMQMGRRFAGSQMSLPDSIQGAREQGLPKGGQGKAGALRGLRIENKASDSQWENERPDRKYRIVRHQRKTRRKWELAQLGTASPARPLLPCYRGLLSGIHLSGKMLPLIF